MDFVNTLHMFEDALYEVVIWVVLLPKTLVQVLVRPGWIQPYVNSEWGKEPAERFQGYISPMLFWFLLGILPYAVWTYKFGVQPDQTVTFVEPVESNFLLTAFGLIIFPTYYAILLQRLRREPIEKNAVKRLFYIQCYVHTPIALFSLPLAFLFLDFVSEYIANVPFVAMSTNPALVLVYAGLIGLWVVLVESVMIHAELKINWPRAVWLSLVYGVIGFVLMTLFLMIFSALADML
jgi:hypothetical protein